MATSAQEDRRFIESIISSDLLEDSINWIKDNLEPQEVFSESQLEEWAKNNGFINPKYNED